MLITKEEAETYDCDEGYGGRHAETVNHVASIMNTVEERIRQLFLPVWNETFHFSKVLIQRQDFIRLAEISTLGPAWTFLKQIIEGKTMVYTICP